MSTLTLSMKPWLIIPVCILFTLPANAEEGDKPCVWPTMKAFGRDLPKLTLRKTTDGSAKDEAKPASIGYENPDVGSDYFLLDAAIRWEALECNLGSTRFILIPGVEVHRSESEANPVKKVAAKVELELLGSANLRGNKGGDGWPFLPYFKIEYGQTRDSIKDKTSSKAGVTAYFTSNLPAWPGGWIAWKCDPVPDAAGDAVACPGKLRWLPSLGVEYYDSLPVERTGLPIIEDINTTVALARLTLEYWPLLVGRGTSAPGTRLQFLAEYTYRPRIDGDPLPDGNEATLLTYGLTYYFDADQVIGLGLEREDGESPIRNFRDEERTTLSLRMKF